MICTKHLYLFIVASLAVMLAVVIFLRGVGGEDVHEAVFVTSSQDTYTVSHNTPSERVDKQGFIERVREALRVQTQTVSDTSHDDEEVLSATDDADVSFMGAVVSYAPRVGSVYVCATPSRDIPPVLDASWIQDGVLNVSERPVVGGQVVSQQSFSNTQSESGRSITTNSVPSHAHGVFSLPSISATHLFSVTLPSVPVLAGQEGCVPVGGPVGILTSGAFLYSGVLEGNYDAEAHATFDGCGGHVDARGVYHYHSESECVPKGADGNVGYALDGFAIFPSVENGVKVTNESLDACHGHAHIILWNGEPTFMYHYHMTDEYPYALGCFKGTPAPLVTGG
jgi:hypothetical protein